MNNAARKVTIQEISSDDVKETEATDEPVFSPDRTAKIAEIAYYKAENRDFQPGYELDDWLEAEKEVSF